MTKLGYLGPIGTFTHDAALIHADNTGNNLYELAEFTTIRDLILAVSTGKVDQGMVPMENSIEGTVNLTMDMLIHEVDVYIAGELLIPIKQYLMSREGVYLEDLTRVLSHPQALAQCRKFLDGLPAEIKRETAESTAAAAKAVKLSQKAWAAIGNYRASQIYGLKILKEGIQDNLGNTTRFILLSRKEAPGGYNDKTSLVFTVDHKPGGLFHALEILAQKGINLTKIESRPMGTHLGEYLFWVDFEGNRQEDRIGLALDRLHEGCSFFKILGSYPRIYP